MARPARTHHERILATIMARITSGAWPPGHKLPEEIRLAEEFGVSRMTMNKALSQLTRDGFLTRQRKLGTFVARPMAETAVLEIPDIEAELARQGLAWRFALSSRQRRRPGPGEIAAARIAAVEEEVLALCGVHLADEAPYCHESRIINLRAAPGAEAVDFTATAPGSWLLRQVPWTAAEHHIRAVAADPALARDLGLAAGAPCLQITRRTETAGEWVTLVIQTYPAARHQLYARFTPAAAPAAPQAAPSAG